MNVRLTLLRHLRAAAVRSYVLDRLALATADAFGSAAPAWRGLSFSDRLATYARFTAEQAAAIDAGAAGQTSGRLHHNAESLGADFRRWLSISEPEEAFQALQFLYAQIGIKIEADRGARVAGLEAAARGSGEPSAAAPSGFAVTRCFFSDFYSPETCRLMSAFDAGVVAGLFPGRSLEFNERITEGAGCCRAVMRTRESQG